VNWRYVPIPELQLVIPFDSRQDAADDTFSTSSLEGKHAESVVLLMNLQRDFLSRGSELTAQLSPANNSFVLYIP
jgi:hypothetical protein